MKKKIVIIIVAAVLLLAIMISYIVYRVTAPAVGEIPFLPSELPVTVKVAYYDKSSTWQEVELGESEANAAVLLYQKLEGKFRYHSDCTVDDDIQRPWYWYHSFIKNNGGTVQFYFAQPLQYNHSDICACKNYHYAEATYDHIDLIYNGDVLLVNFISGDKIIATYNMSGSYLPSFREILSAYHPAAFVE